MTEAIKKLEESLSIDEVCHNPSMKVGVWNNILVVKLSWPKHVTHSCWVEGKAWSSWQCYYGEEKGQRVSRTTMIILIIIFRMYLWMNNCIWNRFINKPRAAIYYNFWNRFINKQLWIYK